MQKITPFLWFNDNAEEAMNYYVKVFKNSKIVNSSRYPEGGPGPAGKLMVATFEIEGQEFMVLNGGRHYKITPAVSFMVHCDTQEELDHYWNTLTSDGGQEVECGWLTDKFGVSWQIVPRALGKWMSDPDKTKTARVFEALMKMKKLSIPELQKAFEGK
jgi:predicted 3-demethylubiquinone-9 3-methyltransferase (glyoxalase superfamily)